MVGRACDHTHPRETGFDMVPPSAADLFQLTLSAGSGFPSCVCLLSVWGGGVETRGCKRNHNLSYVVAPEGLYECRTEPWLYETGQGSGHGWGPRTLGGCWLKWTPSWSIPVTTPGTRRRYWGTVSSLSSGSWRPWGTRSPPCHGCSGCHGPSSPNWGPIAPPRLRHGFVTLSGCWPGN